MLSLESPVSVLPSVGPKYKKLLENLDIYCVNDLLYHIPFRYEDYSQVVLVKDVLPNQTVTLRCTLGPVNNIFTKYGKKLTKATASDQSGKIELIWFNQHYIKNALVPGITYSISGKIGLFNSKPSIISPEMEEVKEGSLNTGRLVPVYPETQGVSSKWLRSRINDLLSQLEKKNPLTETLPEDLIKKYQLKNLWWAMKNIHFPDNKESINNARGRLEFEELFYDLLKVEKRKYEWHHRQKSYKCEPHPAEMRDFIDSLPFKLTDSQNRSIAEIIEDIIKPHPMNRLLEGDVGTGKTVVAVLAAYLMHLNGFKTVYLAPTEILAQQHYETFSKLLAKTEARVNLLTGSNKIIDDDFDVIIGTHALLYKPELFKNVGLTIIDEQHRFGVEQRGRLLELSKEKGYTPNLLSMTATPIPRTLALTIYGDLSLSTLKTHPMSVRSIVTKVVQENQRSDIYKLIREKQLSTFIVCPFIEISESENLSNVKSTQYEFEKLKKGEFAEVPMGMIHGRMKSTEKQQVIDQFRKGEIKVLVATPVIEVGIDIPDATIMIIEGGERYGLASLHQLRGRIGRQTGKGFCFVFLTTFSSKSYERLKNLETVNDGLKLAEIDMKMRGQGDLFSTMQHGYKKYKVASLDNFELLEQAKEAAQEVFNELDTYPLIEKKLIEQSTELVRNN